MAIAGILIHVIPSDLQALHERLQTWEGVIEARVAGENKIAASAESRSDTLPGLLQNIQADPQVLDLELVYVNYEDDLDSAGNMPAPPLIGQDKR